MNQIRVSGVILAAGPSRRFGTDPPKQLVVIDGEPLVRRVVLQALDSDLAEVIVVTGLAAARVELELEDLGVRIVGNPRFDQGQSTSVRAGLAAVEDHADAAIFIPADLPRLSATVINAIIDCYRQTGAPIIVPTFQGRRGAPALIDRALFEELATIEGDTGGRQIFPAYEESLVELPLASGSPLQDLDTPEDLQALDD